MIVFVVTAYWHNELETDRVVVGVYDNVAAADDAFVEATTRLRETYGVETLADDCVNFKETVDNDGGYSRSVECEVNWDGDRFSVSIDEYDTENTCNVNDDVFKTIG